MRLASYILVVAVTILATACSSTREKLQEQELDYLLSLRQSLQQTNDFFATNPEFPSTSEVEIFYSVHSINDVLRMLDGTRIPIDGFDNTYFYLSSVRADFQDDFSNLHIDSAALRGNLEVQLKLTASLTLHPVPQDPSKLRIKIHIDDLVPVVRWWFFQFKLKQFVSDLLLIEAHEFSKKLPPLYLPIEDDFSVDVQDVKERTRFDTPDGHIDGKVTYSGTDIKTSFKVDRLLPLKEGLHIYISFE